eukprot:3940435-Rhodomonas_salina.4
MVRFGRNSESKIQWKKKQKTTGRLAVLGPRAWPGGRSPPCDSEAPQYTSVERRHCDWQAQARGCQECKPPLGGTGPCI